MPHNVFIGIDYDTGYKAVEVTAPDGKEYRFETGDPTADWKAGNVKAYELTQEFGCICMTLSSSDGFVFDVPGWRWDKDDNLVRAGRIVKPEEEPIHAGPFDGITGRPLKPKAGSAPPSYLGALLSAQQADTPEKVQTILEDLLRRLREANSAAAVNSAASILEALVQRGAATANQEEVQP